MSKNSLCFQLSEPVMAHGEQVKELVLREPTAKDIRECGFPLDGKGNINTAAIAEYISNLAAIPPSSVDNLSAGDFSELMGQIVLFFVPKSQPISSN